jgi:hypothetical protein
MLKIWKISKWSNPFMIEIRNWSLFGRSLWRKNKSCQGIELEAANRMREEKAINYILMIIPQNLIQSN